MDFNMFKTRLFLIFAMGITFFYSPLSQAEFLGACLVTLKNNSDQSIYTTCYDSLTRIQCYKIEPLNYLENVLTIKFVEGTACKDFQ